MMLVLTVAAFLAGRQRGSVMLSGGRIHSLPTYHGLFLACLVIVPLILVLIVGATATGRLAESSALSALAPDLQPQDALTRDARLRDIRLVADGVIRDAARLNEMPTSVRAAGETFANVRNTGGIATILIGFAAGLGFLLMGRGRLAPQFRARNAFEKVVTVVLIACSAVAILTTVGIIGSVLFESLRFFARVSPIEFLFGLEWSPQTALRADQGGSSGAFGAVPLFVGTTLIMLVAMCVAGPIGLFAAIYMAEYASPRFRAFAKPILEVLAGIPTVVFGFFAALTVAPFIKVVGGDLGLDVASESALAAGIVMGVMIIPFISSLSDDVITAVPQSLRDGSYGMGATKSETIKKVVLPAALPGIVSAFMLAVSRAVGETMIVVMAAGLAANLTFNPLNAVTTVTVQIKALLVGDQEFDSAKTLSAFALGLLLFFFTLILNMIALRIVKKYREQYD